VREFYLSMGTVTTGLSSSYEPFLVKYSRWSNQGNVE